MGCGLGLVRKSHPGPAGGHKVGSLRTRLPTSSTNGQQGLLLQAHYPAAPGEAPLPVKPFVWFRKEVLNGLADGYGVPRCLFDAALGGIRQLHPSSAPLRDAAGDGWPVLIFCSGIYGCCEMYTQFCSEVASFGAIVLALEHEDGAGIYAVCRRTGKPIFYKEPPEGCDPVAFRHPFLQQRARELADAVAAVGRLVRREVPRGGGAEEEALLSVMACGDPSRLLLVGHSFGASGIVRYFTHAEGEGHRSPVPAALLLDPYLTCLPREEEAAGLPVRFVQLLSGQWQRDSEKGCRGFAAASGGRCLGMAVASDTLHQWISESHFFAPGPLLRLIGIKGRADHLRALRATVRAAWLATQALLEFKAKLCETFAADLAAIDGQALQVLQLRSDQLH